MNPQAPNFLTGGDPSYFQGTNQGTTTAAISQLSSSNFGQQAAQQAERISGRNFQEQEDQIKSNPAFGRNAAVTSALTDRAAETAGAANANAVTKGAEVDANDRSRAAGLSMQQEGQEMQENELNYSRAQDASFGNSFLGHALEGVVGTGLGVLTGGVAGGAASAILGSSAPKQSTSNNGTPAPDYSFANQMLGDATFGKGEIKMLVGRDGKTYTPRSDDGVSVGTKLGSNANKLMPVGSVQPPQSFKSPMELDWNNYKLGHAAFDYANC
jgi:hypothetical protein